MQEEARQRWIRCGSGPGLVACDSALEPDRSDTQAFTRILKLIIIPSTGQKFAGAPDIVKSYFPQHTTILWILIAWTYFDVLLGMWRDGFRRIGNQAAGIFACTTTMAALGFKLSFAAYDAMELVPSWLMPAVNALADVPLVNQARAVFGIVGAGAVYTCICERGQETGNICPCPSSCGQKQA